MRSRLLSTAIATLIVTASILAQTAQMAGVVRDEYGAVFRGALVELTGRTLPEKVRATTTDAGGRYRFDSVPSGDYSIAFSACGYSRQIRNHSLADGTSVELNVVMKPGGHCDQVQPCPPCPER